MVMLWIRFRITGFESFGVFAGLLISYLVKTLTMGIFYVVVVWVLKQCNLFGGSRGLGETCCFRLQVLSIIYKFDSELIRCWYWWLYSRPVPVFLLNRCLTLHISTAARHLHLLMYCLRTGVFRCVVRCKCSEGRLSLSYGNSRQYS